MLRDDGRDQAPITGRLCAPTDIHGDASNIAAVLMGMAERDPLRHERIIEAIRLIAPFFGGFVHKETSPGKTRLLWKDRFCDLLYDPTQLSDGTARFVCLATLLLGTPHAETVLIDEPELGLHPYAIKILAGMLHEAAETVQIIVSTQSSLLLDEVEPETVIVVDQKDGKSDLRRLSAEELREWLEDYTLGQLWEKSELGGVPQ